MDQEGPSLARSILSTSSASLATRAPPPQTGGAEFIVGCHPLTNRSNAQVPLRGAFEDAAKYRRLPKRLAWSDLGARMGMFGMRRECIKLPCWHGGCLPACGKRAGAGDDAGNQSDEQQPRRKSKSCA